MQLVQTALFAFSPLTRSLTYVYGGITQYREIPKVGSNPVRVAIRLGPLLRASVMTALRAQNLGSTEAKGESNDPERAELVEGVLIIAAAISKIGQSFASNWLGSCVQRVKIP
jgi:hypothetical protein